MRPVQRLSLIWLGKYAELGHYWHFPFISPSSDRPPCSQALEIPPIFIAPKKLAPPCPRVSLNQHIVFGQALTICFKSVSLSEVHKEMILLLWRHRMVYFTLHINMVLSGLLEVYRLLYPVFSTSFLCLSQFDLRTSPHFAFFLILSDTLSFVFFDRARTAYLLRNLRRPQLARQIIEPQWIFRVMGHPQSCLI